MRENYLIIGSICQSCVLSCCYDNKATQENQRVGVSGVLGNWNAAQDRLWDARS